ncbi:MAG: STAS/SEC14 domain-containing protein [Roseovarius sp.]
MIEIEHTGDHGILEIRMTAPVTDYDYTEILIPAIDAALVEHDSLRVLAVVEAGFADFTLGAMLQDARTGLKHWRGFDRAAVVTDNAALKAAIGAFSVFMPCPVGRFAMRELEDARRWLRESLGSIQQEEIGEAMLHVRLRGKLDTQAYANDLEDLNRFMARYEKVRLLIDLRDFDGWQGLSGLRDHFELVRGHAHKVERAAVLGDAGWQDMAAALGRRVLGFEARHFKAGEIEAAKAWLAG